MGLLIADSKTFSSGITLTNSVASIRGSIREVQKLVIATTDQSNNITYTTSYRLFYKIYYYASQTAYSSNANEIDSEVKQLDISEQAVSGDLFAQIYTHIASGYQNTTAI